ncbi:MAG: DUF6171 family protein [Treponema sp.]|jgi:ribosomal protein L37E|nr:DUF6171 family protein [Treponema sp.]
MKPCPRCGTVPPLLTPEQAASLGAEIPISPKLRAEASVYAERLDRCGECSALREQILCAHCGCLVVFRARLKNAGCPSPEGDLWSKA